MNKLEVLFGNLFDRTQIMTFRLVAFARFSLNYLITNNQGQVNDLYIDKLTTALTNVESEMDEVDLTLATQLVRTGTVDEVVSSFETTMSAAHVDISYLTRSQPDVIKLFYPRGKSEYNNITRAEAPVLMGRVKTLAQEHAALLTPTLVASLTSFEALYTNARNAQLGQMSRVATNRSQRNEGRPLLELTLTELVREVGRRHPGDVNACKAYFRWHVLYAPNTSGDEETEEEGEGEAGAEA